ncbi:MAG: AAA family ATPase [Muribaculaceae bacterium]|nr:AAA family ATPase [Muribaculaceae bacterium]
METVKKFKQEFFNAQNNRQKVSLPLLTDKDIDTIHVEDGEILYFVIPRASRQQRPVYIGQDPMTGTYRRNNEGDYICDPMQVSQMFAERDSSLGQVESRVLNNYTWDDIDMNSFRQYRTMFSNLSPSHPWTALDDLQFMQRLGGYRMDRRTGKEGFTMAGILMFGKEEAITDPECAPDFMVDYREIPSDTSELRWVDRLYPDGTWEANLFQFYRLTLPRLQKFLPKPFKMKGDTRIDESPAHVAVREALINCIVHAQYGGSRRINVFKTPKGIRMSNPGTLLVSPSQFYEGGISETRNPALQRMFGLIGKSDKAGSGVDKILKGWREANWRSPYIEEMGRPDKVELFMPMETLIDNDVVVQLKNILGDTLNTISHNALIVLATAFTDVEVSNTSLQPLLDLHPSDISKLLRELCNDGFLESSGFGKGTTYHLAYKYEVGIDRRSERTSYNILERSSEDTSSVTSCNMSCDKLNNCDSVEDAHCKTSFVTSSVTSSDGLSSEEVRTIKEYCRVWRNIGDISRAIRRNRRHTRSRIVSKLLQAGLLEMEYPDKPTHPAQRYRTVYKKEK